MNARVLFLGATFLAFVSPATGQAERSRARLDPHLLDQDKGAVGAYQKLLKLRTTASVMHITAHPDDEDAALLTWLSRGLGARTSLLTLNRGETGDNAIGPELFDALGLIRTEELREAGRYYGLDAQYYTTVIDYGFSKRLDEAIEKWGHDRVLKELVSLIRRERPMIIISRFQGNKNDGHGNHQAAGLIAREAFEIAGDPNFKTAFEPWKPLKFYKGAGFFGGDRKSTVSLDVNVFSPWLGETYANFAGIGYAMHRSQNNGNRRNAFGPRFANYDRVNRPGEGEPPAHEDDFFDGIDTTLPGLFKMLDQPEPEGMREKLKEIEKQVNEAIKTFRIDDPSTCVALLAEGFKETREAFDATSRSQTDAALILARKEIQFEEAISAALGIRVEAFAAPAESKEPTGRSAMFASPPTMGPAVPGQALKVTATVVNPSRVPVDLINLDVPGSGHDSNVTTIDKMENVVVKDGQVARARYLMTISSKAQPSRPYFSRKSLDENVYTLSYLSLLTNPPELPRHHALLTYRVEGATVEVLVPVLRLEADPPFGRAARELEIVPRLALSVNPREAIIPLDSREKGTEIKVEIAHNASEKTTGEVRLAAPEGWRVEPTATPFAFERAGERATFAFRVMPSAGKNGSSAVIQAVAKSDDAEYREGYEMIKHRDLATRYLYRPATIEAKVIDVKIAPNLKVGYVMGIGDNVPRAIEQLGATVTLLNETDLADGDLSRFDAIMTGTRAYAVREDLKTYNARLLEYVKKGGNLIVLYNTPELVPDRYAPFPAKLPGNSEEVTEEDSPVVIVAPNAEVLNHPNVITKADFDGWVEQRGSKFWSEWDKRYGPIVSTRDRDQKPQEGGWLTATFGDGRYTYFAYALHRQLPSGVPGAYRLLANLLSQGKR